MRSGQISIRPTSVSEFVANNPPVDTVDIRTGAWNIGTKGGFNFSQWDGSSSQKRAVEEIWELSRAYHKLAQEYSNSRDARIKQKLDKARHYLLRAETSCYLYWGDAWIPKLYEETAMAHRLLDEIRHTERL